MKAYKSAGTPERFQSIIHVNIHFENYLLSRFDLAVLQEETSITRSVAHLSERILYC